MIRVAWCDKIKHKYYEGDWYENTKEKQKELKSWVNVNNINRSNEYYWLEIKEDDVVKNYIEQEEKETIDRHYVELVFS